MKIITTSILPLLLALHTVCQAQNFPDRIINYDPLGDHGLDTAGFSWLSATQLHAEFSRYSNGSGASHRWNAKTGGYVEVARWDSTWSLAVEGTTEITIDPQNDIAFNPRAICWEEGILLSYRIADGTALQLGGVQRCKHDIDNLEAATESKSIEQRTLIFSGVSLRALFRPRPLLPQSNLLSGGLAIRNEFYVHTLDHRVSGIADQSGRSLETMINTSVLIGRLDLRPDGSRIGAHLGGSFMLTFFGDKPGFSDRFSSPVVALGSFPFLELGADFFNPAGGELTLYARGEWQRDAAILPKPVAADLVLFGIRFNDFGGMW